MLRAVVVAFLIVYCFPLFSQPAYSRDFEARKKNVPLGIINNHSNYFFLLRYNKAAHDITLERRAKPSAEIISFTPLKLDSVNADWFNYEQLDYLYFEHNYKVYFLFEKVLNSKTSLYLKIVDTLGKASGFIELASLEKEKGVTSVEFEYKQTRNNNILIIASQTYGNFLVKKTALLFDTEKKKMLFTKKLPVENAATGYSTGFECNQNNELYYLLVKAHIVSYKRKYANHTQIQVPVLFYDTLSIVGFLNNTAFPLKKNLAINNLTGLKSVSIIAKEDVTAMAHLSMQEKDGGDNVYFLSQKMSSDLTTDIYAVLTPLDKTIKESLTFFDGTDYKEAGDKDYKLLTQFNSNTNNFQLAERIEDYYYKELLFWQNDPANGKVIVQKIIPRKVYSFKGRTRFKNIGAAMPFIYNGRPSIMLLESPANFKTDPNEFNYHKFKKETNLWRSNIVIYTLTESGSLEKKLISQNSNFDMVPMQYQSVDTNDIVLYLNNNKSEKFLILKQGQF